MDDGRVCYAESFARRAEGGQVELHRIVREGILRQRDECSACRAFGTRVAKRLAVVPRAVLVAIKGPVT